MIEDEMVYEKKINFFITSKYLKYISRKNDVRWINSNTF